MDNIYQIFFFLILKALILTIVIELIVLLILRERNYKIYLLSIIINIITNVSLNIYVQFIDVRYYYLIITFLEILIVIIEAIGYNLIYKDYKKSLLIAFLCNIASYLLGLLLMQ